MFIFLTVVAVILYIRLMIAFVEDNIIIRGVILVLLLIVIVIIPFTTGKDNTPVTESKDLNDNSPSVTYLKE